MNFVLYNYARSNSLHFTQFILTNASKECTVDRCITDTSVNILYDTKIDAGQKSCPIS